MKRIFLLTFVLLLTFTFLGEERILKKVIAVMELENKTGWRGRELGEGLTEMLITSLQETGRFIIVERKALKDILQEQKLGEEKRLTPQTAPKRGRLLGAQILVRGAITEFEQKKGGGGIGLMYKGIGIGGGKLRAHVALDIRLYDTATGEIISSKRAEAEAVSKGLAGGVSIEGITIGGAEFEKTPLGKAAREAIEKAVEYIVEEMEKQPWVSRIIKVKDNLVYMVGGEDMGIKEGDIFYVYSLGEELIDPATGLSLGREEEKVGKIRVKEVKEKYSKAEIIEGKGFKSGDLIRDR
ncbi:hypothetical protein J7K56_01380 [Candidatus Calescamantes bacterium]|nr:hypothetical protein [Candidatus Calescamantes bacterium]